MINEDAREYVSREAEGAIILDNPAFDNSIVGISTEGCVVYNYQKMIEEYCKDNSCSHEDAKEFIDYNTVRMIPYLNSTKRKPVIVQIPYYNEPSFDLTMTQQDIHEILNILKGKKSKNILNEEVQD